MLASSAPMPGHQTLRPLAPVLIVACAIVATLAARWAPVASPPAGLAGRYFANAEWSGTPILERLDDAITPESLASRLDPLRLPIASVEWSGYLVVREAAVHRFAIKSNGASWLWIDDRLLVENGDGQVVASRASDIHLSRGLHRFRVRYVRAGGPYFLQLGQVSAGGLFAYPRPLTPTEMTYAEWRARELWPLALVFLWYASLLTIVITIVRPLSARWPFSDLRDALSDRTFLVVAGLGLLMSAAHLLYGLPARDSWSPDERDPISTLAAASDGFSGWNLRWPPLHLYFLAGILEPFERAAAYGLPLVDPTTTSLMFVAMRALSLTMLAGALVLTFDIGRHLADRATAYFAVALLATSPVVVHFGPLAHLEIPHLFWMTASLWAWTKFTGRPGIPTAALFGAIVGFSLATKDQAYGFYLAVPVAVLLVLARRPGPAGARGWGRLIGDTRVLAMAAAALTAFAAGHALPWGIGRLDAHVRFMLGSEVRAFRMVPATLPGQLALLRVSATAFVWAAGLPLTAAFLGGCAQLIWRTRGRSALWLLVPLVTYYVTVIAVILYVYDRFFIGALPAVAVIGGIGLASVRRAAGVPRLVRAGVPAALLGTAAVGAIAQNVAFSRDPRDAASQWLASHVACGSSVGVTYNPEYVPSLTCYDVWTFTAGQMDGVMRWPEYFVLNEAYIERFRRTPSGGRFLARLESGELGFRRAFKAATSPPLWAPLYWEARFRNNREDSETALDKPLHAIEVWTRLP
jgi:hypothetical protein